MQKVSPSRSTAPSFESLRIWHDSRRLAGRIYELSKSSRDFGLRDQMRSAAVSVMSNIAEGFERRGDKEFLQFLKIASGSAGEVRSQLYIAEDVGMMERVVAQELRGEAARLSRRIASLIETIRKS